MEDEWTSVISRARGALRKRGRSQGNEVFLEDVAIVDTAPSLEDAVFFRARLDHPLECTDQLPVRTRAVFLAHRLDGTSTSRLRWIAG